MRRYATASAILLILSIIDFALATPVLVQEKRRAYLDVVNIPKDVFVKRGSEKLLEELSGTLEKMIGSSDAHASSSSLPPGPAHGSMDDLKAPAQNPASSPANPDPLIKPTSLPSSPSPIASLDHESTGARARVPQQNPNPWPSTDPDLGFDLNKYVQQLIRGPSADPGFDFKHWTNLVNRPSLKTFGQAQKNQAGPSTDAKFDDGIAKILLSLKEPKLASSKEFGQAHEVQVGQVQQPVPGPSPDPGFDRKYWMNSRKRPPLKTYSRKRPPPKTFGQADENHAGPLTDASLDDGMTLGELLRRLKLQKLASSKEFGQAHENPVGHVQQPNPGPSSHPGTSNPGPSNPRLRRKSSMMRWFEARHQDPN